MNELLTSKFFSQNAETTIANEETRVAERDKRHGWDGNGSWKIDKDLELKEMIDESKQGVEPTAQMKFLRAQASRRDSQAPVSAEKSQSKREDHNSQSETENHTSQSEREDHNNQSETENHTSQSSNNEANLNEPENLNRSPRPLLETLAKSSDSEEESNTTETASDGESDASENHAAMRHVLNFHEKVPATFYTKH